MKKIFLLTAEMSLMNIRAMAQVSAINSLPEILLWTRSFQRLDTG